ncbi:methyltransferase domain-containing protein [Nakamurella sp. YIM 132087]|uniref:Methyltransferase domain-containing protein n=1 Tax=Nakamurella alba TaxID=2665158 RepID=A0A7K1FSE6_9ACTN|nr:methyltransferase domain-containing protein [Nakamurella alba]
MPPRALAALACPHCGEPLAEVENAGALGCPQGHRFDLARQGYVSLLGPRSRTDTGDSVDMVQARVDFLAAGGYAPIAGVLADLVSGALAWHLSGPGLILEIGSGTGHYLSAALDAVPGAVGIALDASKPAAKRAAADPRVCSVVADAWAPLPVRDASVDVVTSVFAPRVPAEIARVLAPGGSLIAVLPDPAHLAELRGPLGLLEVDEGKVDRLAAAVPGALVEVERVPVRFPLALDPAASSALVRMGPAARHLSPAEIAERVAALPDPVSATAAVTAIRFRRSG